MLRSRRVIVAAAGAATRSAVSDILAHAGAEVTATAGAGEALVALTRMSADGHAVDLLVADRDLPGLDGAALARAIAAEPGLMNTRCMLLAPIVAGLDLAALVADGVAGVAAKPCPADDLLTVALAALALPPGALPATRHGPLPAPLTGMRCVVVDDDAIALRVATAMLEHLGAEVHAVTEAGAALTHLAEHGADVVLTDLIMPSIDGLSLARAIREHDHPLRRTTIIAMSAESDETTRRHCTSAGIDGLIGKPLEAAAVTAALGRRSAS